MARCMIPAADGADPLPNAGAMATEAMGRRWVVIRAAMKAERRSTCRRMKDAAFYARPHGCGLGKRSRKHSTTLYHGQHRWTLPESGESGRRVVGADRIAVMAMSQ